MKNDAKYRSHLVAQGFPKHLLFFISSTSASITEFQINMVKIFVLYSTSLKNHFLNSQGACRICTVLLSLWVNYGLLFYGLFIAKHFGDLWKGSVVALLESPSGLFWKLRKLIMSLFQQPWNSNSWVSISFSNK